MQPENPRPYDYLFIGGLTNRYTFVTSQLATYAVHFIPSTTVFSDEPDLSQYAFELVIELVVSSPVDTRIGPTIAMICDDFLRAHERVLLYVCETSDRKHRARVRKFDWWYEQYNTQQHFAKIDTQLADPNGLIYHISMLLRWKHPEFHRMIAAFERLTLRFQGEK